METNKKHIGVIDLGTNTFHILIVEVSTTGTWEAVYRERIYVKLGEGGVGFISKAAQQRAMKAMRHYKQKIAEFDKIEIKAVGTAALRKATNAEQFIQEISLETSIDVEIIPGDKEASLIARGVEAALPKMNTNYLIMDIGGGSVEFVYRNTKHQTLFSNSYEIGVVILHERFHQSDPISGLEISRLDSFLDSTLKELKMLVQSSNTQIDLVGASGTFDVLEDLLEAKALSEAMSVAKSNKFHPIYNDIIHGTLAERLSNVQIPDARAELIVVAMHLIHYILANFSISSIYISKYAMKEGILEEMIEQEK